MNRRQRSTEAELTKAATRAVKHVIAMVEQEPTVIFTINGDENETDQPLEEITAWLFKKGGDNGHSGN